MIHVVPKDDVSHELATTCECVPRLEFEEGEMIVIHDDAGKARGWSVIDCRVNNLSEFCE